MMRHLTHLAILKQAKMAKVQQQLKLRISLRTATLQVMLTTQAATVQHLADHTQMLLQQVTLLWQLPSSQ